MTDSMRYFPVPVELAESLRRLSEADNKLPYVPGDHSAAYVERLLEAHVEENAGKLARIEKDRLAAENARDRVESRRMEQTLEQAQARGT